MTRRWAAVAAVVVAVTLLGVAARATTNARTTADEPHYLLTALSLWEDRSLDYGDERSALRYWPFHGVILPVQAELQPDGSRVAPHDPLLPVLLAAPMGLGGWVAAKAAMAAMAAGLAVLLAWALERRAGLPARGAAVVAVLAACSPPLAVYATQIYPELPGALAALAAYALVTAAPRRATVAGAVAAITALPWLSVKYAPVAAVLALGLLVALRAPAHRRLLAGAAAAFGVAGITFAAGHLALYGGLTPYAAGTHFGDGELTVMGNDPDHLARAVRLTGLVVDRDFGLAAWQPLFLLLLPAIAGWAMQRRGPERWLLPATFAAGWGTATFLALTMHGWWWPGRQTVVVLPLGIVAVAAFVARASRRVRRAALAAGLLGPWTFLWLVGGVMAGRHTLIVDFDRTADPVGRAWRTLLPDLRADTVVHDALHGMWVLALTGAVLAVVGHGWRRRPAPPATDTAPAGVPVLGP